MVIENITQRDTDFREERDNLLAIRKYLREKCSLSEQYSGKGGRGIQEPGSVRDISGWLNKNGSTKKVGVNNPQ